MDSFTICVRGWDSRFIYITRSHHMLFVPLKKSLSAASHLSMAMKLIRTTVGLSNGCALFSMGNNRASCANNLTCAEYQLDCSDCPLPPSERWEDSRRKPSQHRISAGRGIGSDTVFVFQKTLGVDCRSYRYNNSILFCGFTLRRRLFILETRKDFATWCWDT